MIQARCQGASRLSLLLKIHNQEGVIYVLLAEPNEEVNRSEVSNLRILYPNKNTHEIFGWSFREYSLEVSGKLRGISSASYFGKINAEDILSGIQCEDLLHLSMYDAFLGHIAISDDSHEQTKINILTFKCSGVSWGEVLGKRVVSLKLAWTVESLAEAQIVNYRIFVANSVEDDGKLEHLGVAMIKSFYVFELPVPEDRQALTFYIQVSLRNGVSTKLAEAPAVTIQIP
jgi:hypothetical protein